MNEYQNQKKKENSIKKINEDNDKIFNTNILEELENYSTTITQASNNEKMVTITPFEIFRRCEENKRLFQKEKNLYIDFFFLSILLFTLKDIQSYINQIYFLI